MCCVTVPGDGIISPANNCSEQSSITATVPGDGIISPANNCSEQSGITAVPGSLYELNIVNTRCQGVSKAKVAPGIRSVP
jgi:hypothetical protein